MTARVAHQHGSLAAESAVVTPLLVLLMLFVVFAGRVGQADQDVRHAASEAARAVSLLRAGNPTAVARGVVRGNLTASGVACSGLTVDVDDAGLAPGATVTVTVGCQVDLTGVATLGLPRARTLTASSTQVVDTYRGGADDA